MPITETGRCDRSRCMGGDGERGVFTNSVRGPLGLRCHLNISVAVAVRYLCLIPRGARIGAIHLSNISM